MYRIVDMESLFGGGYYLVLFGDKILHAYGYRPYAVTKLLSYLEN